MKPMRRNSNIKFTSTLINLSKSTVYLYEDSTGDIWTFPPSKTSLPDSPDFTYDKSPYYIVDKGTFNFIRQNTKRNLADIAVISEQSIGRGNVPITVLCWGSDPTARVRLKSECYLEIRETA